ncbi:MAG: S8 family serine peptidase [Gammaproteobacteria bacterium]|nr:S8 family serine peptidase [Gammaproteobacteria bacterium]
MYRHRLFIRPRRTLHSLITLFNSTRLLRITALRVLLVGVCAGICALEAPSVSANRSDIPAEAVVSRLIVRLQDGAQAESEAALAARFDVILATLNIQDVRFGHGLGTALFTAKLAAPLTLTQATELAGRLNAHPDVIYAEPDGRVRAVAFIPHDPLRASQWHLFEQYGINAYAAWDLQRGAARVVVAILDTGLLAHADIDPARVLNGYDFVSDPIISNDGDGRDPDPTDPGDAVSANECGVGTPAANSTWHGLHLAGVIGATADNGVGVSGINHASRLLPVRVLGKCGGDFSDIIKGIMWSAGLSVSGVPDNPTPAQVINLSFAAASSCTPAVQDAIDRATAAGAIVVAAAGNGNGADVANTLPAGCDNVIAVTATDRAGAIAAYANVGNRVLLGAPGGDAVDSILSVFNTGTTAPAGDTYAYVAGTSVAAAQVSAAVSLLLSAQPGLTLADVRLILRQTTQAYAGGCPANNCGAGILDLYAAVQAAAVTTPSSGSGTISSSGGSSGGGCTVRRTAEPDMDTGAVSTWVLLLGVLWGWRLRRQVSGQLSGRLSGR